MEDLKLDDEPLPVLSSEGVGSLRSILIARESGTLGRLPPRCISSKFAASKTTSNQTLNSINPDIKLDNVKENIPKSKKPCMIGLERLAQEAAEERLAGRELKVSECELRGRQTKSAFLVVFSPDRDLMASTHGDHNIYVSQVSNGKCISTLKGHPRTPWCVAFHPTRKGLLASGCLGGHVRLWDLMGDGSEVWRADGVVASLAFHPTDRLLVVATFNELHFWDWSRNLPFAKVTTASEKEKVRYVKFDTLGHQLITGIANLSGRDSHAVNANGNTVPSQQHSPNYLRRSFEQNYRSDYMFIPPRLRGSTNNAEADPTYGLTAYSRYRSYMSGMNSWYPTIRRERERSELRNQSSSQTSRRVVDANDSGNTVTSNFHDPESVSNRQLTRDGENSEAGENSDRNSSASQTLSDLAAAASNRLMAENAAENAATHQTTRSLLTSDSQNSHYSHPNRHDFIGALRSHRDPFFGTTFGPPNETESSSSALNPPNSSSEWASSEEMEAIRQSQIQQLRTFRSYQGPRSPPILSSDIDSMLRQDEDNARLRDYNSSFSHSPESSFIEVNNSPGNGRNVGVPQYNGTNRTQIYARSTARESRALAQERYRAISERRLRRLLGRRQALVSQIEELRNARDYLTNIDRRRSTDQLLGRRAGPEMSSQLAEQHGQVNQDAAVVLNQDSSNSMQENTNASDDSNRHDGEQNRSSRTETRVIDDWARARRRRLESYRRRNLQSDSYQIRRSYNHFGALNLALNRRNATMSLENNQSITQYEANRSRERLNISEEHNQSSHISNDRNSIEYSSSIIEPEVVALPESSSLPIINASSARNLSPLTSDISNDEQTNLSNRNLIEQNDIINDSNNSIVGDTDIEVDDESAQSTLNSIGTEGLNHSSAPNTNNLLASSGSSRQIDEWNSLNSSIDIQTDNDENIHNDHTYSNLDIEEIGSLRSENIDSNIAERNQNDLGVQTDDINSNSEQVVDNPINPDQGISSTEGSNISDNTAAEATAENSSAVSRSNLDIILLSRHIDHMQRICRASLADCALNRHRRQVVRLQSIRRMLEDLQRQIRCLRAASNEELSRRSREAENLGTALGSFRQTSRPANGPQTIRRTPARANAIVSHTYQIDDANNQERDNEEEGHFDLIDEDAATDDSIMTAERTPNFSTIPQNNMNSVISANSYRTMNRPQPASRINNINYQLRTRAFNRISRNTSSRLRRDIGSTLIQPSPRIYRYPGRHNHLTGNSSTTANSTVTRPLRNSTRNTETVISNFETGSAGRRYYRGSHVRFSRGTNPNTASSLPPPAEPRSTPRSRRARLSRAHNQLFTQLRATVRAIEMSPSGGDENDNNDCNAGQSSSSSKMCDFEESSLDNSAKNVKIAADGKNVRKLVQIKNSSKMHLPSSVLKGKSNNRKELNKSVLTLSTKDELRALSQRLEKLLKDQREQQSIGNGSSVTSDTIQSSNASYDNDQDQMLENPISEGEKYLLSLPRPDSRIASPNGTSLSDPRLRWRHLMEGIDEHILNDPLPPRRSARYGFQRHSSSNHREHDMYIRQNYRNQRRDSSPLTGRIRTSRVTQPSRSLLDGTLPSIEVGTDSGSDTDDVNLNSNESREFPHNSSLEWNGGTSSSPLFRYGLGRWPVRRMSRREELLDISGLRRNLNRSHGEYTNLLSPNRTYDNEELEERWREDRRRIRNRASARLSRMRLLERPYSFDNSTENSPLDFVLDTDDSSNRLYQSYLSRARSPVTTTPYSPPTADIGTENQESPSENQDLGVNINGAGGTGALDIDRLPPLRELIWRRLRRRNAQLNMLEDEIAGANSLTRSNSSRIGIDRNPTNQENSERPSTTNASGRDINRPHREFLTWMVDQMRLDHETSSSQSAVRRVNPQNDQNDAAANNSFNEREIEQATMDPSTRHISFSREFITPPPIQYRHRYLNLQENGEDASVSLNDSQPTDGVRINTQEVRPRPSSYAAAAVNGAIAQNSISGSNPSNNPQTNAAAATFQREHYYLHNAPANMLLTHRIQSWDFNKGHIPDLRDSNSNLVVNEARIHNDASVDVSEDGSILVTLIPSNMPMTTVVGVYGLKPDYNRGRCYAHFSLESSAVSVSLSPTSRYLLVGLAVRTGRLILSPTERTLMGQIFRIQLPHERNGERGRLVHRKDLHQTEQGQTSLNCIRWIPVAGQGIVYATNTGLLKILR